jgi:soluble lytic murein transglycosylase
MRTNRLDVVDDRTVARLAALLLLATACGRSASGERLVPATSSPARDVLSRNAPAAAVAPGVPARDEGDWVRAFRRGDHAAAAKALDAAPGLSERPELRFARARAARALKDDARALALLDGLEERLPALLPRIQRLRAEAALGSGPHATAASLFEAMGDPESLVQAALARERAGESDRALALATRVVTALGGKRRRSVEADAREVRARVAERAGKKTQAVADLRWLALEQPLRSGDPDLRLAALSPTRALTREERLSRALALGRAGARERAELELSRLEKAPGPAISPARLTRARALALYHARGDYRRASELFLKAASGPGVDVAEATFFAARSLARAQDDAAAVRGYRAVLEKFGRTSFGEQAAYLIARTHYAGGAFSEAASAYDAYLGRFGAKARFRGGALYERGVTYLALGRHAKAASTFGSLASTERDDRKVARLRHLEAVGRAGAGERERAVELFRAVARQLPLSFAALAGAARLAELGAPKSAPIPRGREGAALPPLSVELPDAVVLLRSLGLDRDAEEELRRTERQLTRPFGARAGEAACAAYALLDTGARRYQIAQSEVERHVLMVAPTPATRWQWDCVYPRPHARPVEEMELEVGVPQALLYGVMRQESGFRTGVSSGAGARGLMQLMPATAERLAEELGEPFDAAALVQPGTSLRFSAHYLKKLLTAFDGNVPLAVAAYNAGPVAVRRWLENGQKLGLDVFVARIPYQETLEYVERVMGNFARYRYLEQGDRGVPALALSLPAVPAAHVAPY